MFVIMILIKILTMTSNYEDNPYCYPNYSFNN